MSIQRDTEVGNTLNTETRVQKKARLAHVLERGFINYKLDLSFLPPSLHGEWARFDPNEMARLEALGFEIYKGENLPAVHGSGDGTVRVGDAILVVTPKENADLLAEIQQERIDAIHGLKPIQAEEKAFKSQVDGGIVPIVESRIEEMDANAIIAAKSGG